MPNRQHALFTLTALTLAAGCGGEEPGLLQDATGQRTQHALVIKPACGQYMTFTFEEAVFRAHLQNIGPWTSGGKTPQEAIQNTMRFIVASNARQQYKDMLPVDKKTGQKIAACPGCPEGQSGCTFGANNGTVDLGAAVPVNPVFSVNAHGYVTCTISDVNWNLATGFEPSAEVGCSACRGGKCTGDSSSATPNAKTGTDSAGKVGTTTQPE